MAIRMKKEDQEAKAKTEAEREAEIVAQSRRTLVAHLPEFVEKLIQIARKPQRNSQTQMKAITEGMNRAGLMAIAVTEIRPPAGQDALQISVRFVDPPKQEK